MPSQRSGITMVEVLMALAVGMLVLNMAFIVFVNTSKFFNRIESVSAQGDVAQSLVYWVVAMKPLSGYPAGTDPSVSAQARRIGAESLSAGNAFVTGRITDFSQNPLLQSVTIVVPRP